MRVENPRRVKMRLHFFHAPNRSYALRRHTGAYAVAEPTGPGAPCHVPTRLAGFVGPGKPTGGVVSATSSTFQTAREVGQELGQSDEVGTHMKRRAPR